jgi:hypothetical protein
LVFAGPEAADNRWLREAFENRVPIIYFLGIAPGRYQAMLPTFICGWDDKALKACVAFGGPIREPWCRAYRGRQRSRQWQKSHRAHQIDGGHALID